MLGYRRYVKFLKFVPKYLSEQLSKKCYVSKDRFTRLSVFQTAAPEDEWGTTCDRPDNKYGSKAWQKHFPKGQRLDYLMYATNRGKSIDA